MGGQRVAPMTPGVKKIMVICAAVFVLQLVSGAFGGTVAFLHSFGIYPPNWDLLPPVWQLLTYGFLHDPGSPSHILWNMLLLYFLGTSLEALVGTRRFLTFYVATVIISGTAQLIASLIAGWGAPVIGASGAVLGVVIAMATLRPKQTILFIFIPLTLKTMAFIVVGKDLLGLLMDMSNGGQGGTAHIVHLAGAAVGYLGVRLGWIWRDPMESITKRVEAHQVEAEADVRKRLDKLLGKISREGITSLSSAEKKFLKRASKR
ncbi:MAG: membrane associated rhomboid family serine protease [Planctomycetota bacterium]|jgi:membrane associated rhomboid family serine protease